MNNGTGCWKDWMSYTCKALHKSWFTQLDLCGPLLSDLTVTAALAVTPAQTSLGKRSMTSIIQRSMLLPAFLTTVSFKESNSGEKDKSVLLETAWTAPGAHFACFCCGSWSLCCLPALAWGSGTVPGTVVTGKSYFVKVRRKMGKKCQRRGGVLLTCTPRTWKRILVRSAYILQSYFRASICL